LEINPVGSLNNIKGIEYGIVENMKVEIMNRDNVNDMMVVLLM
jgi:hypothetical protein